MLKKDNFFKSYFTNLKAYKKNVKKTKIFFNSFLTDLENNQIPLLESYEENYDFDFSTTMVKKFSKYKNIIVIGMGGSILGTKSIYTFLKKKIRKEVFFFDNLDSDLNLKVKKIKNLKNSCFVVVSKSGNTIETITNLNLVLSKIKPKNKLVIITEISDNSLFHLVDKFDAEIIEHKNYIGGRYSVLSEVGMVPAILWVTMKKNSNNLII